MGWLRGQRAALAEALRRLAADPLRSVAGTLLMALGAALALAAFFLAVQSRDLPTRLSLTPALTVYLDRGLADAKSAAIAEKLRAHPEVAGVHEVGRDAALRELAHDMGVGDLADGLGRNPLSDALVVAPRDPRTARLDRLRDEIGRWPGIEAVQFDRAGSQRLDALRDISARFGALACLVCGLLALFAAAVALLLRVPAGRTSGGPAAAPSLRQSALPAVYAAALQAVAAVAGAAAVLALAAWFLWPALVGVAQGYAGDVAPDVRSIHIMLYATVTYVLVTGALGGILEGLGLQENASANSRQNRSVF